MRYPASDKLEIIRLVETSPLPVRRTLDQIGIPRSTFYAWYDRYLSGGLEALKDRKPRPKRVWNRIADDVRERVIGLALDEPELSPRELAVAFTDRKKTFIPSAGVRIAGNRLSCAAVLRRLRGVFRNRRRLETGDALAGADEFLVYELVDAEPAELAAEAGPLHTAERQFGTVGADQVDVHHARFEPVGDPGALLLVGGEDVGTQPERGVVGDFDGLLFGGHLVDGGDRTEQFLPIGGGVGRDVREHTGREVGTLALSFGYQVRAVVDGPVHLFVESFGRGDRRQRRKALGGLEHLLGELVDE